MIRVLSFVEYHLQDNKFCSIIETQIQRLNNSWNRIKCWFVIPHRLWKIWIFSSLSFHGVAVVHLLPTFCLVIINLENDKGSWSEILLLRTYICTCKLYKRRVTRWFDVSSDLKIKVISSKIFAYLCGLCIKWDSESVVWV